MNSRLTSFGRVLVALVAVSALSLSGTVAEAGNGHGHGKHKNKHKNKHARYVRYEEPRQVVVVERPVHVVHHAPVYTSCEPRYVSYYSPRAVVVRPAPYVQVGARIGSVDIAAVFGSRPRYVDYDYGCNFCEAHFNTYQAYDVHVHGCDYRPRDVQIQARMWDDQGYGEWRGRNACSPRYAEGYGRGYDDGYDRRYDDDDWND